MRKTIATILLLAGIAISAHGIFSFQATHDPYARWALLVEIMLGLGLLFWSGLLAIAGAVKSRPWLRPMISLIGFALAFVLILAKVVFEKSP